MRQTRSYTDLSLYRKCPRLFAFSLEFEPLEQNEAINTGIFTHKAISAYFRGMEWQPAIEKARTDALVRLNAIGDTEKRKQADKRVIASAGRAYQLSARYIDKWAKDYRAPLIEPELTLGKVVAHPDLIAYLKIGGTEFRTIVDFKTSKSPDMRWYDISGQVDLYTFLLEEAYNDRIGLVAYDIISDEGIYRHTRPPQLKRGKEIYDNIDYLAQVSPTIGIKTGNYNKAHFQFDCPNRCVYWECCYLYETDGDEACKEYLEKYYIRREDENE